MEFRRAEERDCLDLLSWRNDPDTVRHSLTGAAVPEEDHRRWFARVLTDAGRILLIVEQDGGKIGMVRFDRDGDGAWEVSIGLAPAVRGKGIAASVLAGGIAAAFPADRPDLLARVKADNPASRRIFQHCGFILEKEDDGVEFYRKAF